MLCRMCVLAGVLVRRVVATQGRAALLTRTKMDPACADRHAFGAFAAFRFLDGLDSADVSAGTLGHGRRPPLLVQNPMDKSNCNRPLADGRRDSLEAAAADIADCKHSRQTGLEQMREPGQRPVCGRQIVSRKIGPRLYEPARVERNTSIQPESVGNRTSQHENVLD